MTLDHLALVAVILLLFPMVYFLLASPGFLLVKLDLPIITRLLRGLFSTHFLVIGIVGALGTVAFAIAGRPIFALCVGAMAAFAIWVRPWFLRRIDAEVSARDAGDASALRRLRRLHVGGMALNAIQFAAVVRSVPLILVLPAS